MQCPLCHFKQDITYDAWNSFMKKKDIAAGVNFSQENWYNTTNHCMKRSILESFVDWYYQDYKEIKNLDIMEFPFNK